MGVANVKKQFSEGDQYLEVVNDELRIIEGSPFPCYHECIEISTNASLREMIPPALLVLGTPIVVGVLFGVEAVCGLLVGSLISAVQLAISQSNSGGAWDNAKKYVEAGQVYVEMEITKEYAELFPTITIIEEDCEGIPSQYSVEDPKTCETMELVRDGKPMICKVRQAKKTELHKAAVTGDTVGDP